MTNANQGNSSNAHVYSLNQLSNATIKQKNTDEVAGKCDKVYKPKPFQVIVPKISNLLSKSHNIWFFWYFFPHNYHHHHNYHFFHHCYHWYFIPSICHTRKTLCLTSESDFFYGRSSLRGGGVKAVI